MELEVNHLTKCNFIRNLCKRISEIHTEVLQHESGHPKCEVCREFPNEYAYIKNQLFLVVKIDFLVKEEVLRLEDRSENREEIFEVKEETEAEVPEQDPSSTDSSYVGCEASLDATENELIKRPAEEHLECALCGVKVSLKANLAQHIKLHIRRRDTSTRKGRFQPMWKQTGKQKCSLCKGIFKKKHDCKALGQHTTRNTFLCAYCPEVFTTYPKIYKHHKTFHPGKTKPVSPFQCEICGAFALRSYTLKRHMMFHTDNMPFECDKCEKKFRTRQKLKEHQRLHIPKEERDDKNKCNICQKQFHSSTTLKTHKALKHTERKTYDCNTCGRKFLKELSLHKHLPTHAGEESPRNYKCKECGMIFEEVKYLNQHRKRKHNIFTDLMLKPKTRNKKK